MRFSTSRIFWITLFSMLALLSAELVSSAPFMSIQMTSTSPSMSMAAEHCMGDTVLSDTHASHNALPTPPSVDCDSDPDNMHNCCGAACLSVFAYFPPVNQLVDVKTQRALIPLEPRDGSIALARSLYRPPIA